jgi:hypothetical protein
MSVSRAFNETAAPRRNIDADIVLETIVSGFHWSALHIGTIATVSNACVQTKATWTLRPWVNSLRENSKIMRAPLRYCENIGLSAEVGADLMELYARLSEAKALAIPLADMSRSYNASEHQRLGQLQVRWRILSLNAIEVAQALKGDVKRRLAGQYYEDSRVLVRFLTEAAHGDTKRVGANGEMSPPMLGQRRQTPRIPIQAPCRLVLRDARLPAILLDVSRDGVGVICDCPLDDRQAVSVELDGGRLLKAIVVRRDGDRKGLLLLKPLAIDDPLLQRDHDVAN